ncbi:Asparaginyl-tRNA synthetase [Elusimicrobium minutum Pei191]|uniref:Asparagine--tRNA ligase n=1 Tax=Elusimicrobium minutum (strain Pei191) TaxID=445932 RepID=B2KCV8_ELUMP|nr:asparagine--tRNA ligase [Elusimicrobium minutum]ACC98354.1 Asparaginyl-tRNA synthetase [Elusimicrobium minutum Pei191]
MPQKIYVNHIGEYLGSEVTLNGWVYNMRSSGKLHFIQLRDGSGIIQCVIFKGNVTPEVFDTAANLTQETSVSITGTVKEDNRSKLGFELDVKDIKIIAPSVDYPITPKEHGDAFLMHNRHLWLRSSKQTAILKIRDEIIFAIRKFFHEREFTLVDSPILTPAACEGRSTLFETEYFGEKAFLSQSGQLYGEAAAMALGKIYCFGPTFRAEKSKTRRHLTEFWMVEPEVAFNDLNDNMELAEDFIVYIVESVLKNRRAELELIGRDISKLENIKKPFPRVSYTEAIKILNDLGNPTEWGGDIGGDEETLISNKFDRPVIIHRYPAAIKAFYMKRDPEDPKVVLAMDVIGPEGAGEIIGGSERESDYNALVERMKEQGMAPEDMDWYLDLRKYGSVPHSGFGMGIERMVRWICGLHHVRETIPFARMMDKIRP